MPYAHNSRYVLASEAIPEIARRYFNGNEYEAESDARLAARDGELPVFSDSSVWGEATPFHEIDKDIWHRNSINWSGRRRLYFRRADLLKHYPNLWKSTGTEAAPAATASDQSTSALSTSKAVTGDTQDAAAPADAEAAAPTVDPFRTGAQGRPTAKHLVQTEARRRAETGKLQLTLAESARELAVWLPTAHPGAPPMTAGTIENAIRAIHPKRLSEKPDPTKTPTK